MLDCVPLGQTCPFLGKLARDLVELLAVVPKNPLGQNVGLKDVRIFGPDNRLLRGVWELHK